MSPIEQNLSFSSSFMYLSRKTGDHFKIEGSNFNNLCEFKTCKDKLKGYCVPKKDLNAIFKDFCYKDINYLQISSKKTKILIKG